MFSPFLLLLFTQAYAMDPNDGFLEDRSPGPRYNYENLFPNGPIEDILRNLHPLSVHTGIQYTESFTGLNPWKTKHSKAEIDCSALHPNNLLFNLISHEFEEYGTYLVKAAHQTTTILTKLYKLKLTRWAHQRDEVDIDPEESKANIHKGQIQHKDLIVLWSLTPGQYDIAIPTYDGTVEKSMTNELRQTHFTNSLITFLQALKATGHTILFYEDFLPEMHSLMYDLQILKIQKPKIQYRLNDPDVTFVVGHASELMLH